MNNQVSISRYILVILCVSIVFTALTLIVLNSWVQNKKLSGLTSNVPGLNQLSGKTYDEGYKAGFLAAREKYKKLPPSPGDFPVQSLSGTVNSVDAQKFSVKAITLDTDPLVDGVSDDRTVLITSSTIIVLRTNLSNEEFNKKMIEWGKTSGNNPLATPPDSFTEKTIPLSNLKPGQTVSIITSEDIRLKETFPAKQIIVMGTAQ